MKYIDRSDRGIINIWRTIAVGACGIILTLVSTWYTHGVSKDELKEALTAQGATAEAKLETIKVSVSSIETNQNRMMREWDDLILRQGKK